MSFLLQPYLIREFIDLKIKSFIDQKILSYSLKMKNLLFGFRGLADVTCRSTGK